MRDRPALRDSLPDASSSRKTGGGLVEYVANVSEGRRVDVIRQLAEAARVPGVAVLDVHSDVDHNRSVITVAGTTTAVRVSALHLARAAAQHIDMRVHRGTHPRIGALDVLPFVPLGDTEIETCVEIAHEVGREIGNGLGIPVYFYGEAALIEDRRLLVDVRRGEYEGLVESIATDLARWPDAGPPSVGPAGATAVGARPPLIAINVHLRTDDVSAARGIARVVRASSGGLPGVLAIGLTTSRPGICQVSMNLVREAIAHPELVIAAVRAEADRRGIGLAETELVGLMPAESALAAGAAALGLPSLRAGQVVELALNASEEITGV